MFIVLSRMQTQKGQKVGNVLSGPTNKCVLMCLSTHTNQAGTKVNKGQKQQLRQLKMDGVNFLCAFHICHCVFIYFIHTDTMTVIKAIYSPILATFLVGGMCVLFPLLKFERTEGGRVNSY